LNEKVIEGGKPVKTDVVRRGRLLVYNDQEWALRAKVEHKRLERQTGSLLGIQLGLVMVYGVGLLLLPDMMDLGDYLILTMFILYAGSYAVMFSIIASRNRNPPAIPGIYENGIQLLTHVFLPYPEIGTIERTAARRWMWMKREIIFLLPKGEKGQKVMVSTWFLPVEFLGMEGMARLKERLEDSRGLRRTAPALHIYDPNRSYLDTIRGGRTPEISVPDMNQELL
jgi:hypothetical protein